MKFSVLIPTRNRLKYLKYAIETVLKQDYADWELIVSDNDSVEDIEGYILSLNDPRIKYYRTDQFIPVTDNWNNALHKSSGEYVIMLGDDDALMKGYFSAIVRLIQEFNAPDFIYTGSFIYAYPCVIQEFPEGCLWRDCNFISSSTEPFFIDRQQAIDLVRSSMNFRMLFPYNMQHSAINRKFIDALHDKGEFFQSPYPDFYATNVMFLKAERILIYQRPFVTIGITPSSFGFFHFNNKEKQGMEFLKNAPSEDSMRRLQHIILPGNKNNTLWLFAMETIKENYKNEFNLNVNYQRYRYLQILNFYKNYYLDRRFNRNELVELHSQMSLWEKLVYHKSLGLVLSLMRLFPKSQVDRWIYILKCRIRQPARIEVEENGEIYQSILDVFEKMQPLND